MDHSPTRPLSPSNSAFFLFLLVGSNLLTFFLSSSSTSNCSFTTATTTITTAAPTTTTVTNNNDVESMDSETDESSSTNNNDLLPSEFHASTDPQELPLGYNPNFDSDIIYSPVGHPCTQFPDLIKQYMSYDMNGPCPDDELLAQKLLLKGCEPLPRRRCRPAAPLNYVEPFPLPKSLWSIPSDNSVVWTHYHCKNYSCLLNRSHQQKGFSDCKDCFELGGREKARWIKPGHGLNFNIDEVLAKKKPGTVRIGLDIGGGTATFAVRMRERNITIVTTSMNLNGPFNSFIAARGVIPLYLSISQRLPFFDNTLDIVHSMHVLNNWIPAKLLHFLLFDIYRVLRPGGFFWLDHFFCLEQQLEEAYVPMIETIGFKKVKWETGRKFDRGPAIKEMYLSALLEKPLKKSW
ncbi:probable methyltransferase At1g29790 [Telopea speciosissima]|uniref:probable methyltransferase At1g29790 n=1 Tax=Telopea speciosissima TaxID=54955 RepID=UPI001CC6C4CB|nr:probable methyltransferase At1g29790 [Telopea speciosissima]